MHSSGIGRLTEFSKNQTSSNVAQVAHLTSTVAHRHSYVVGLGVAWSASSLAARQETLILLMCHTRRSLKSKIIFRTVQTTWQLPTMRYSPLIVVHVYGDSDKLGENTSFLPSSPRAANAERVFLGALTGARPNTTRSRFANYHRVSVRDSHHPPFTNPVHSPEDS